MSIRSEKLADLSLNETEVATTALVGDDHVSATISAAQNADSALGEAGNISVNHPDHPLRRSLLINIRASLADLCLRKQKGSWAPTGEALRSILQQKKFVDLNGSTEATGDLKSVVLHSMTMTSVTSDFDVPIGVRMTAVDNSTYGLTGEGYSHIVAPKTSSHVSRVLQKDDVALAYEFSRKFPGYTSSNLMERGIHEVSARRFVLISADHPIVSAISENASKLQVGDIVKAQVESQIKVRDLSAAKLTIEPADATSWTAVRNDLIAERKAAMATELEASLSGLSDPEEIEAMRLRYKNKEKAIEAEVDSRVHNFSLACDIEYNFLSK